MKGIILFLGAGIILTVYASVAKADTLECSSTELSGVCPLILKPVCGSDGHTYGNKCSLCSGNNGLQRSDWVKVNHDGPCNA